ncbi:MAG: hypothetical protein RML36_14455 [Anaerolineae bacterium]|nr:hypothetical protein [Anaerolineae bacterium]MDW8100671.1 hypothetical protein [Anaerolineae bacterium]
MRAVSSGGAQKPTDQRERGPACLALLCICLLLAAACARSSTAKRTFHLPNGTITVPGEAYIDGRNLTAEEPYTYMSVGVVEDFAQTTAKCTIRHGTRVEVLDATRMPGGITLHFKVRGGFCTGWIAASFLSDQYHEPIGKLR